MYTYRNRNTGDEVALEWPSGRLDALPNWERVEAVEAEDDGPVTREEVVKTLKRATVPQLTELAAEREIVIPEGTNKPGIVKLLADAVMAEED